MSNPYLTNEAQLLYAKILHDIAAPLGALTLCMDDIKNALPESAELVELSIETLSQRISYWRLMVTGSAQSPTYSDAATAIRAMAKLKSTEVTFVHSEDYQGEYVRLLLALALVCLESLPRGGKLIIDADQGNVTASGEKCYISKEIQDAVSGRVDVPSSRHSLGMLIYNWAKNFGATVNLEHEPTKLLLTLVKF